MKFSIKKPVFGQFCSFKKAKRREILDTNVQLTPFKALYFQREPDGSTRSDLIVKVFPTLNF